MFNFLRNRFIAIAASSIGGEEKVVVQQQKQRHNFPPTSGVNITECGGVSGSSSSYQNLHTTNNMTETTTTIDQNLMDESYFLNKFDEYEKNDSWDKVFSKVNSESDSQAKKLSLCCNLSNNFHEKNRYRNVLPYDQNRIKLQSASSEHEAYINASPLELPFARRNYILTQGPLPNTTGDFWQMIYEQNVSICIMLSKVMEKSFVKCHSYFPHKDSPNFKWDNFECLLELEEVKPNYIIRRIRLTPLESFFKGNKQLQLDSNDYITPTTSPIKPVGIDEGCIEDNTSFQYTNVIQDKSRIIHHFQFTTWPDFGVPDDTDQFLEFLEDVRCTREMIMSQQQGGGEEEKINSLESSSSSSSSQLNNPPIVCHCSAGIGRTGTFVIVDSVLSMIEMNRINKQNQQILENIVNYKEEGGKQRLNSLESLVVFIRKHRMGLIQTSQQLRFCWKTIVDWINKQQKLQQFSTSPTKCSQSLFPPSPLLSSLSSSEEEEQQAGLLLDNNSIINLSDNDNNNNNNSESNGELNKQLHGIDTFNDINNKFNCSTTTTTLMTTTTSDRRSLPIKSPQREKNSLSPGGDLNKSGTLTTTRGGSLSPSKCA